MSHYDYPDSYYIAKEALERRRRAAMETLLGCGLGSFTVDDLISFITVIRPPYSMHEFNESDCEVLERLAKKAK